MFWVLAEIIIPLILAVLLGLLLGWMLWRWRHHKETFSEWETDSSSRVSKLSKEASNEWEADKLALTSSQGEMDGLRKELASANAKVGTLEGDLKGDRGRLLGFAGLAGVAGVAAGKVGKSGEADAESVKARLVDLDGQLSNSNDRVKALESQLASAGKDASSAEGDLASAQKKAKDLEGDLKTANGRIGDLEGEAKTATGRYGTLEGDLKTANGRIGDLEGAAKKSDSKAGNLDGELVAAKAKIATLEGDLKGDRGRLLGFAGLAGVAGVAAGKGGKSGEADADSVKARLVALEREAKEAGDRAGAADRKLQEANARANKLETDLASSTKKLGAVEIDLSDRTKKLGAMEIDLNDRTKKLGVMEVDLRAAETKAAKAESSLSAVATKVKLADGAKMHPYGDGSHGPLAEKREMPVGYPIKGNVDSMLYHRTDSRNYGATIAEVWFDTAARAESAGFGLSPTHPEGSGSAASAPSVKLAAGAKMHPYGDGSHGPLAEKREMPVGYPIKGNVDSMLYHRTDSRNYGATIAEVWFDTAARAESAGFGLSPTHPEGSGSAASAPSVKLAAGAKMHPYGDGSHGPLAEKREMPVGYPIKGNVDSMLYHRTDSRNYGATIAEVWFDTAARAESAGFGLSPTHPSPK